MNCGKGKFFEWIEEHINPERKEKGFKELDREESDKCYDIMEEFSKNWSKE